MTKDEWVARANTILAELRVLLGGLGLAPSPSLRVVADLHPCPGYVHDALEIGFCPPVVDTRVDALRWTFFAKAMGLRDADDAALFYEVALPFVVAHETSHHLRTSRGRHDSSHFIEEQACDQLAAAFVEAHPVYRATLVPLRDLCARMRDVLARGFASGPSRAFVPDASDLVADDAPTQRRIDELRAITAREGLSFGALALLAPELGEARLARAEAMREEARRHLDLHYARDPAEYWFASVVWLSRWLGAAGRPSLAEVVDRHLGDGTSRDAETILALGEALRHEDPVVVEGAAAALVERFGPGVAHDLVDEAERDAAPRGAVVRVLARAWKSTWDAGPVRRVVRLAHERPSLRHVARLAAVAGVPFVLPDLRPEDDPGLRAEALAAMADEAAIVAALADPRLVDPLLDALVARGRKVRGAAPPSLPARGTPRWEGLVRVLSPAGEEAPRDVAAAALAVDLHGGETAKDRHVLDAARAAIEAAFAARSLARSLVEGGDEIRLARLVADGAVRRTVTDVALALGPSRHRVERALLLGALARPGEAPPVLVDLALSELPDLDFPLDRATLSLLFTEGEAPESGAAPPFSALERAIVARALPSFDAEPTQDPTMASLLDRMLHLRRVALFSALSAERLADLAHVTLERRYRRGDTIVRAGERGDELYLLVEGEVRLTRENDGASVELAVLRPPAFFGEMTLFDDAPRSADARAATDCFLYSIDGNAVRDVGRRHPEVYEGLLALLSHRVRATSSHLRGE